MNFMNNDEKWLYQMGIIALLIFAIYFFFHSDFHEDKTNWNNVCVYDSRYENAPASVKLKHCL